MYTQKESSATPPTHGYALDALRELIGTKALFSVAETSGICGRSKAWTYRQMARGRIGFVLLGERRAITRGEVIRIATEGVNRKLAAETQMGARRPECCSNDP
jgi:hypothetical protein